MDRPALRRLLADVDSGQVDVIVVYKVDRLTRALSDFAKIVEALDARGASFVSGCVSVLKADDPGVDRRGTAPCSTAARPEGQVISTFYNGWCCR